MESIYWVISRDCNQQCAHCYNNSEPGAPGLTPDEVRRTVSHFPDPDDVPVGRIIVSGGEVLVWPDLLFAALDALYDRYQDSTRIQIQTNGDLLDEPALEKLLDHHVQRIDVSSMDKFHPKSTRAREAYLRDLLDSHGMVSEDVLPEDENRAFDARRAYSFWGANPDTWIGPLWPRGRAWQKGASKAGPEHRFCSNWSGAIGFLDYRNPGSEVNIQLADVYPCCPMTCRPLGNLLEGPLVALLDRCAQNPVYQALNQGRPEAMGESLGIPEEEGFRRSQTLGNHCLWCDEFFTEYAPELLYQGAITERGDVDLAKKRRKT
jgi:hypothetical protein